MYPKSIVAAVAALMLVSSAGSLAQQTNGYKNLQVLDKDISRDALGQAMLQNLQGLGLPRRQREGCLFCHVGSLDQPVSEWDFAADDKETKLKARVMMRMVADINANYLGQLEDRIDPNFTVSCVTCHAGRTDPRPLHTLLQAEYAANGAGSTISKYDELRKRYYGTAAYDFRPYVLTQVAVGAANSGQWSDALLFARKNEAENPGDLGTSQSRLQLEVAQVLYEDSVEAGLDYFVAARDEQAEGVADASILNGLGWSLNREGRADDALQVLRRNLALYPADYVTSESLADVLWSAGERQASISVLELWVGANPQHEAGRMRLASLRDELAR